MKHEQSATHAKPRKMSELKKFYLYSSYMCLTSVNMLSIY